MKPKFTTFLLGLGLICPMALQAQSVSNQNAAGVYRVTDNAPKYVEGEVIVKFKDASTVTVQKRAMAQRVTANVNTVDAVLQKLDVQEMQLLMPRTGKITQRRLAKMAPDGKMIQEKDLSQLYVAKFDGKKYSVNDAINALKQLDNVEYAEPNYIAYICSASDATDDPTTYNDPLRSQQWGIDAINLPMLWALGKTDNRRPIIAILDTGVDLDHPDLKDNIWTNAQEANGEPFEDDDRNDYPDDIHGYNFVNMNNDLTDRSGHGTHVAGIAAAVGNNDLGIIGANPDALIMPLKVLSDKGQGTVSNVVRGIDYALANGADVISMSFVFNQPSSSLEAAVMRAYSRSVVTVAAAGNDGKNWYRDKRETYPAGYQYVVGVMSSDATGSMCGFSNNDLDQIHVWPDKHYNVMAPGSNIMSTFPGGLYKSLSGTSMSTPLVAGAYSRILQYRGFDYARDYNLQGDFYFSSNQAFSSSGTRLPTPFDCYLMSQYNDDNRELCLSIGHEIVPTDENRDGTVDAGETVNVYPTLRFTRGKVTEAKFTLKPISPHTVDDIYEGMMEDSIYKIMLDNTMSPEFYVIVESEVDYGWQINTSGEMKGKTPFTIRLHDDAPHDRYVACWMYGKTGEVMDSTFVWFKVDNVSELSGTIDHDITLPGKQIVAKHCAILPGVTVTLSEGTDLSGDIENYGTIIAGKGSILRGFFCNDEGNQSPCYWPRDGKHGRIVVQDGAKFYFVPSDAARVGTEPFIPRKDFYLMGSFVYQQEKEYGYLQSYEARFFSPDDDYITFEPGSAIYASNRDGVAIDDVDNIFCANRAKLKGTKDKPIYIYGNATFVVNQFNPEWYNVRVMGDAEFITYPYRCCTDCMDKEVNFCDPNIDVSGYTVVRPSSSSLTYPFYDYEFANLPRIWKSFYINEDFHFCALCGKRVLGEWYYADWIPAEKEGFTHEYTVRFKNKNVTNVYGGFMEHCNVESNMNWYYGEKTPAGMKKLMFDFSMEDYPDYCDLYANGRCFDTYGSESNYVFLYLNNVLWSFYEDHQYKDNERICSYSDSYSLKYGALDTPPSEILVTRYTGSSSLDFINRHLETSYYWPNVKYTGFAPGADRPSANLPGMVWTVKVNGWDAHDDYDISDPVGFGDLNIDVWFNRPMDKTVTPRVTMGLSAPYNRFEAPQGEWNEDGTIYSTVITLDAKSATNGVNYIVVSEAKDLDGIEIIKESPEKTENNYHRFKLNVQSDDALSTDLIADAGVGKVTLQWETDDASFEDLLGYNVYRYTMVKKYPWNNSNNEMIPGDTIQVNQQLVDASEKIFVDYDVVPGTTYYYLVREIGTDFQEFDVSNVVSATPLKAGRGDSNGSMNVDIADVVTDVAYILDQNPQPFIFEAADVNADDRVSVLDVVGTVNIIFGRDTNAATVASVATYSIEDGVLWLDCSESLGGIQVKLSGEKGASEFTPMEGLNGLEQSSAWQSETEWLLLAFSMSGNSIPAGRHAILRIGDAELTDLVLSNTLGQNILAISEETTGLIQMSADMEGKTETHCYDMTGREVNVNGLGKGVYVVRVSVNGKEVKTYRLIKP